MKNPALIAQLFGEYLDADDFESVKTLLTDDCRYEINSKLIIGKIPIVDSYESSLKEGKQKFDQLIWGKSKIKAINENEFEVHFSDFLTHQGITHNYKCKQLLLINSDLLIEKIIHQEFPGQKESLEKFYINVGLK